MEKWKGMTIGDYQIVDKEDKIDPDYDYETITVEDLLDRAKYTNVQKGEFLRKYSTINIHKLLSEETYSECVSLIQRKAEGKLPSGLNAIVFLCLKQCGRGTSMTPLKDMKKYKALIDLALDKKVSIGFDSCGCAAFETAIQGRKDEALLRAASDKCESGLFSFYCNVEGIASPCSFCEKVDGVPHIDLLSCKDFQKEVWYSEEVIEWRARLLSNERKCPVYDLEMLE